MSRVRETMRLSEGQCPAGRPVRGFIRYATGSAERSIQLGSDDDTFAVEHAARASGLLVQVAGEVAEAGLAADQAWNVVGHLKLTEQPGSAAAPAP
jgi:hypothetical protein